MVVFPLDAVSLERLGWMESTRLGKGGIVVPHRFDLFDPLKGLASVLIKRKGIVCFAKINSGLNSPFYVSTI